MQFLNDDNKREKTAISIKRLEDPLDGGLT
jgi:hypothetical protein